MYNVSFIRVYAVLARLICTTNKWTNYRSWQFSKSFHC